MATCNSKKKIIIAAVVIFIVIVTVVVPVVYIHLNKDDGDDGDSDEHGHICGFTLPEGLDMSTLNGPVVTSSTVTCNITGGCDTKDQCFTCMEGANRDYVGNINGIPVCCAGCRPDTLVITSTSCDCSSAA